ncbi:hypothetical protein PSH12_13730 [Enterococcus casseliflavus]|uniref:hypothetical protein n=1 Tax=Enterococcus casseliflavus TaxID=37734 RepID=UPI002955B085|nr:hypothetical protein [Enterococcus casseliflavus]MDV7713657.1 hypothetical protein [Enterococcus casseliflavus]
MSRSFRKFPRNKYNNRHMKKAFNRGLRRKINNGLFDEYLLSGSDYRKVYNSYDISEGSQIYPLFQAIQPKIKVESPAIFYMTVGLDEKNNLIFGEETTELRFMSYEINTRFFNLPSDQTQKNPYPKTAIEYKRFEDWLKTVIRK